MFAKPSDRALLTQQKGPPVEYRRACGKDKIPGGNLLSRFWHYHGPRVLNGRVRDGNGCGHLGMVAGKTTWISRRYAKSVVCMGRCLEGEIKAVKRSAVSTGRLRQLPAVHVRPIDLVVFQEPSFQRNGRPRLAGGFTLRCLQRFSRPHVGYPAMPRAGQLAHQRCVLPNPLVLGEAPRKSPAPAADRDRPVSRRSKPSSRTAFIGEQPNPWELLHPQDAMSRHRGAKPPRRCERSEEISLLSPEYLLSVERRPFHPAPPDH